MKKTIFGLALLMILSGCKQTNKEEKTAEVEEKATEWVLLFNSTDLSGWHSYGKDSVMEHWTVENGTMKFTPPTERSDNSPLDIVTDGEYTNFELSVDWKISEGGNSGIFWGVKENEKFGVPYATGPEIQILDNERHPDAKNGPDRMAGALYDMIPTKVEAAKPAGEWNTCVIQIDHNANKGKVTLNDIKISEFAVHGPEWDAMVADSKFNGWDGFGEFRTGRICLQDHNDIVWYRNIKIKELK
ncbi:3-keto-disaccharide hydrolase [Spongiivirga citrea]|uniref:DUF1080 domain-containing protein n=1 Tax=Spongiivirga citrea TaxID=1481457 RepID=A0A6M0CGY4_9FLAO|nr:DUF1080 domain-containing protein [Spongiivirga citrea]NER17188.1 DUF1080 domain-containing protein [Spongiivirga citrea]